MIRILIRVDRGQVELYIFLIFPGDGDMTILAECFGRERLPQTSPESQDPSRRKTFQTSNSFDRVREWGGCWE